MTEAIEQFDCFGGRCAVLVTGPGPAGSAGEGALRARRRMLEWHRQFSRFDPDSELSGLNRDPREVVPVSAMMARLVSASLNAAEQTGGLVDPTLVGDLEQVGYRESLTALGSLPLADALAAVPTRRPAAPRAGADWSRIELDGRTVSRPAGVMVDSGGIAKGLFGDVLAGVLAGHASFAVDACGDVRFGGSAALTRQLNVASPLDGSTLHTFELARGAAATSGIGRRAWLNADGRPAHHLLDPSTGEPAYTGVVQVTALAPTGVEAETRSKAALLSGPDAALRWLAHGGVVVLDDDTAQVVPPAAALTARAHEARQAVAR
jgi:thiamine biosynthesis lipoprotein